MIFDLNKYHRRSIRLKEYDYSQSGIYFITICAENRECLFGKISEGQIVLNELGEIIKNEWEKTPIIRANVALDEFIVMPNHLHGIIIITNRRGVLPYAPSYNQPNKGVLPYAPTLNKFQSPSHNIGAIIRGFKSATAKQIDISRNAPGAPIWQRNYYERIIRDEKGMNSAKKYIIKNPLNWPNDTENINKL